MNIFIDCIRRIRNRYTYKPITSVIKKQIRDEVDAFVTDLARKGLLDRQLVGQLSEFMMKSVQPENESI